MDISTIRVNQIAQSSPIPGIKFEVTIQNNTESEAAAQILHAEASMRMQQGIIATASADIRGDDFSTHQQVSLDIFIPLPEFIIHRIEELRTDDIMFHLILNLLISHDNKFRKERKPIERKYSQKEWSQLLNGLGYHESWIFEVRRTELEGMDKVGSHLQKALDHLNAHRYEDCMANTRIAWKSFEPLLNAKRDQITDYIDAGSDGQEGYDNKSKRIKDIKDKIYYFAQVGIHREAYRVTPEDAKLSYYMTVSMISYLSKIIASFEL